MLRSYLRIAYRTLKRHKGYAFINVFGLAVGLAACLLIGLYVRSELSFDRFHEKGDRIYRVLQALPFDEEGRLWAQTSPLLAGAMEASLPGIEEAVRLYPRDGVVKAGGDEFKEPLLFADAPFFEAFTFPLLRGDPATALAAPDVVVLSEAAARKYFGTTDVVGRRLQIRASPTASRSAPAFSSSRAASPSSSPSPPRASKPSGPPSPIRSRASATNEAEG